MIASCTQTCSTVSLKLTTTNAGLSPTLAYDCIVHTEPAN